MTVFLGAVKSNPDYEYEYEEPEIETRSGDVMPLNDTTLQDITLHAFEEEMKICNESQIHQCVDRPSGCSYNIDKFKVANTNITLQLI